jgi:hypothetical protein
MTGQYVHARGAAQPSDRRPHHWRNRDRLGGWVTQVLTGDSIVGLVSKAASSASTTSVATTVTTVAFSEADLDHEANPRFGLSFLYPKERSRSDPDNADSNAYVARGMTTRWSRWQGGDTMPFWSSAGGMGGAGHVAHPRAP